ncbi:isochorismate synthase [Qingshengfaniella alkalisoli]|uniref:isochorismate synthase n=1 Tax=Qingshengfaniella alkalisoli TaxID=2599296 RepID=A0A5B8J9S2_9RHOB|nr:isochorismate synthase [Qingshengfaniella alkalisoli]QDY70970.1 isochorismate synthase [Qingshengfaniella alkalisoli]
MTHHDQDFAQRRAGAAAPPPFEFRVKGRRLVSTDTQPVDLATVNGLKTGEIIAGALPFEDSHPARLWRGMVQEKPDITSPMLPDYRWILRTEPEGTDYIRAVQQAVGQMQASNLQKVVLARTLLARADRNIDLPALLTRLAADENATAFLVQLSAQTWLVGATPELLVETSGRTIRSFPLAGSLPRQADAQADRTAEKSLQASVKDLHEHRFVVEHIMDTLAPHCTDLRAPDGTATTSTRTMWHLGTRIAGVLKADGPSSLELAQLLHPTPAVCGVPRAAAMDVIRRSEPVRRDYYAGCVGWCDGRGDGAWHVSIRCAEVSGRDARLYAGAGIVAQSDPQSELVETRAKFGALLAALGCEITVHKDI